MESLHLTWKVLNAVRNNSKLERLLNFILVLCHVKLSFPTSFRLLDFSNCTFQLDVTKQNDLTFKLVIQSERKLRKSNNRITTTAGSFVSICRFALFPYHLLNILYPWSHLHPLRIHLIIPLRIYRPINGWYSLKSGRVKWPPVCRFVRIINRKTEIECNYLTTIFMELTVK